MNKYPKELSRGNNNVVIALSKTEAGKIFTPDSRVEISVEAKNMQYANKINNLVVKFIRIDIEGDNQQFGYFIDHGPLRYFYVNCFLTVLNYKNSCISFGIQF